MHFDVFGPLLDLQTRGLDQEVWVYFFILVSTASRFFLNLISTFFTAELCHNIWRPYRKDNCCAYAQKALISWICSLCVPVWCDFTGLCGIICTHLGLFGEIHKTTWGENRAPGFSEMFVYGCTAGRKVSADSGSGARFPRREREAAALDWRAHGSDLQGEIPWEILLSCLVNTKRGCCQRGQLWVLSALTSRFISISQTRMEPLMIFLQRHWNVLEQPGLQ